MCLTNILYKKKLRHILKYYVVTFTHIKIIGLAIYLYAHVRYLKKLLKGDKLQISGLGVETPVCSTQLVFKVTDEKEFDKLVAGDSYFIHGLLHHLQKTYGMFNGAV